MNKKISVSLVVIGDEILNGRTKDLNGSFLAKFLFEKGMHLSSMHFIKDDEAQMFDTFKKAMNEADVVMTSGGVGPTIDDKTKKVLANFFNQKIIEREDVAKIVTENYIRFGRSWQKNLNHYHFFPENFIAVNNPKGLAPGLAFFDQHSQKLFLSGPGVPREFQVMNEQEFLPLIKNYFQDRFVMNRQTVIRTTGIPEEKIFNELCPTLWDDLEKFGKVSSLPHTIGIDIVISYEGDDEFYQQNHQAIIQLIKGSPLASYVWQFGNIPLPHLVLNKAKELKITFGFAESCTGGLTSSKITDLSGSSEVFYGSIISYDNKIKMKQLNVNESTLKNFGAVSIECAKEMALGARLNLGVDYAVSITGIAGPNGGSAEKPVGTVVIGFSTKEKTEAKIYQFPGDRVKLKDRFSDMALLTLLNCFDV